MKPVQPNSQVFCDGKRRCGSLSLVFAGLFFGALLLLDFPKPQLDDLFFVGAGLNLAQGGDFANPLLERQQFPSHFYFVHPPLYSYALAGWLKVFGISTVSFLVFQHLLYLLICGATIFLLRTYRAAALLEWLVPLGVAAAFLPEGLRPEAFSVALTLCGFALLASGSLRWATLFAGFLLMILGASVASRLVFFSAALLLVAFVDLRRKNVPAIRLVALAGLALLLTALILLEQIGFRLGEFWRTFHFHAAGRISGGKLAAARHYLESLSIIQWPLLLLWLALLPFLPKLRAQTPARITIYLLGAFGIAAVLGILGHGFYWYVFLLLLLAATACLAQFPPRRAFILQALLAVALLVAVSRIIIFAAGITANRIKADPGERLAEARLLRPTPEHPLLVDGDTARYVFDYRLPPGCLDWNFSAPFPGSLPTDAPLRPGDIYLIGPASVDWLNKKTSLNLALPKWQPLGPGKSFHEFPRRAYLIRPQDCHAAPPAPKIDTATPPL